MDQRGSRNMDFTETAVNSLSGPSDMWNTTDAHGLLTGSVRLLESNISRFATGNTGVCDTLFQLVFLRCLTHHLLVLKIQL
jgi:hypothetical protein